MIRSVWRVVKDLKYRRGMPASNAYHMDPVRRPEDLDGFAGLWVAVKDGKVIASARHSRDLVPMVREMGAKGNGAVAQFVPPESSNIVVGVG